MIQKLLSSNDNSNYIPSQLDKKIFILKVKSSSKEQKAYMNHMVDRHNNYDFIYESQHSIGKAIGLHRNSVQRLSGNVDSKGLIRKESRGRVGIKKNTCKYILPEIWDDPDVRKQLIPYIPALQIKKRISSLQSAKKAQYLSWKIIQLASVGYIKVFPSIISLNNDDDIGNTHIGNDTLYVRVKKDGFSLNKKGSGMTDYIKNLSNFNGAAKVYLSAYPDAMIKLAILAMRGRNPTGVAWLYFRKVLNRIAQDKNVEPNMEILHSVAGECVLTLPITYPSTIGVSSYGKKGFQKENQTTKRVEPIKRIVVNVQEVPEHTLDDKEKESLCKKYKAVKAAIAIAKERYENTKDSNDKRWLDDYEQRVLGNMTLKYPYLFESTANKTETLQKNSVVSFLSTTEFEPVSTEINDYEYEEVLDPYLT